jgi:hypothetical protein
MLMTDNRRAVSDKNRKALDKARDRIAAGEGEA